MKKKVERTVLEQTLFADGVRLAEGYLEEDHSTAQLVRAVGHLYNAFDSLNAAFLDRTRKEGKPAQCEKGCSWCCHQAVFAVSHEFLYLKTWMHHYLPPRKIREVNERARTKNEITSRLTYDDQMIYRHPCPLLDGKLCMVYQARPMACRIYLSYDLESCIGDYNTPGDPVGFPRLFDFPLRAGRMMNEGFTAAIRTYGYHSGESKLEEGIL